MLLLWVISSIKGTEDYFRTWQAEPQSAYQEDYGVRQQREGWQRLAKAGRHEAGSLNETMNDLGFSTICTSKYHTRYVRCEFVCVQLCRVMLKWVEARECFNTPPGALFVPCTEIVVIPVVRMLRHDRRILI